MLTPYELIDLAAECRESGDEEGYTQCLLELEHSTQPGESKKLLLQAGLLPSMSQGVSSLAAA